MSKHFYEEIIEWITISYHCGMKMILISKLKLESNLCESAFKVCQAQVRYWGFTIDYTDRCNENSTPTNKYYWNQVTLNGDKIP